MVCFVPPPPRLWITLPPRVCIATFLVSLLAVGFWVGGLVVGTSVRGVCSLAGWLVGWQVDVWVGFVGYLGVCTCSVACCVLAGQCTACGVVLLDCVCVWEHVCAALQGPWGVL